MGEKSFRLSSNDLRNKNFRRTSAQYSNEEEHPLLSGFSLSGIGGIESYDFSFHASKLVLVGDANSGKTRLLQILQLALSGALLDHPELLAPYCNDESQPAAITLRLSIPPKLTSRFKLLFMCYTLALRFDLSTLSSEPAKILAERIRGLVSQEKAPSPSGKEENFKKLDISYQLDTTSSGTFLTVTISSGELLWLHERIPFTKNEANEATGQKTSSDYALRNKFIFDSFLIKFIPMKKNMSFKSSGRSEQVQVKPPKQQDSVELSSSPKQGVLGNMAHIESKKEDEEPPKVPQMPQHLVQAFSWDSLLDSELKSLVTGLNPLKIRNNGKSPFRYTFQHLLSDSATFCSHDAFDNLPGGLTRKNVIIPNGMEYYFESMVTSGQLTGIHQLQKIDTGFQNIFGYSLHVKISLKRCIEVFLQLRNQRESFQVINLLNHADELLNSKMILPVDKKIWHNIQLLLDPDIDVTIVHKKFSLLVEQEREKRGELIQKLSQVFRLPLFISSASCISSVDIQFVNCQNAGQIITFEKSGSAFKQVLLLLACIHRRGGGTFIMDQPELFLSIHRQNQIRRYLLQQMLSKHSMLVTSSSYLLPEDCIQMVYHIKEVSCYQYKVSRFLENIPLESKRELVVANVETLLLDPQIRALLFAGKVLMADGGADLRVVNGLYSLVESDPLIVDVLEANLNRNGLALDIEQLLSWTVINIKAVNGIHPLVVTFGYQIPSLVVASTTTAASAGQVVTREIVQQCPSFQHILQVFGEQEQQRILDDMFREVEGLRGTLQQLDMQKAQQLREGEQSLLKGLEDQLRPELNIAESKLQTSIRSTLTEFGIYSWENGVGQMIAKTPKAASKLFEAWSNLPFTKNMDSSEIHDQSRAQEWLRNLELNQVESDTVWRNLPLSKIKEVIACLINEENEEFLRFCEVLSCQPKPILEIPNILC